MSSTTTPTDLERLAEEYLSGEYTVQETKFTDGDSRTKLIHSYGWSPTNYLQEILWVGRGEIWLEYYEDDIRRLRETFDKDEYAGYSDWKASD